MVLWFRRYTFSNLWWHMKYILSTIRHFFSFHNPQDKPFYKHGIRRCNMAGTQFFDYEGKLKEVIWIIISEFSLYLLLLKIAISWYPFSPLIRQQKRGSLFIVYQCNDQKFIRIIHKLWKPSGSSRPRCYATRRYIVCFSLLLLWFIIRYHLLEWTLAL